MALWRPAFLLTGRGLVQFPRLPAVLVFSMVPPIMQFLIFGAIFGDIPDRYPDFPTDDYFTYIAPAIVFFTAIVGIANAGVAIANDFKTGYFQKVLVAPVNMWAILLGRLLSDGVRVYLQAGIVLLFMMLFGVRIASGFFGALLMIALGTAFAIVTVGVLVANVALRTKSEQAVQAVFPLFFILIFLTTAFVPKKSMGTRVIQEIVGHNPAEYVLRPMQDLAFVGWPGTNLLVALGIIALFGILGVGLTRLNYRSVYK